MHTDICAAPVIDETSVRLLSAQLESTAHSRTLSPHGPQPGYATGIGSKATASIESPANMRRDGARKTAL
jgi:hypothetical protein